MVLEFSNLSSKNMTLSSPASSYLARRTKQHFARRTEIPYKQSSFWQIETGVVRTLTWLADGKAVILGLWGAGDIVGKGLSHVDPYQIECLTKVEAVSISLEESDRLSEVLLAHLQQAEELMVIRSYKAMDMMLLRLLSWLSQKFGREIEQGRLIDLRLTHQDLAELLGSTRVTVTRILRQLEQQGLIQRLPLHRILLREEEIWHYEI